MKILFLCHRLPFPPDRGGRIRAFHMLQHLRRDHEVTLAALVRSHDDAAAVAQVRASSTRHILVPVSEVGSWLRTVTRVPTSTPSSFAYFYSPRLARLVRQELTGAYDLVAVHSSSMAPYVTHRGSLPRERLREGGRSGGGRAATLLDFGDMDSQKWLAYSRRKPGPAALGYRFEGRKVQRAEAHLAGRFDLCTCTTRAELETLQGYGVVRHTGWFPNGVDGDYFRPSAEAYDPDTICFLGQMDYYPNEEAMIWFCNEVLPQVRAQRPGLTLSIVGANPSRAVLRLGQRPGVRVTGSVPDVRPHAQRAALSVAPMNIARGTQNKILESLAMGVPVVASALAAAGTETVAGEHLLTARAPREFVAAILRLLGDPQERQRLARAGRERVLTHHDWTASMRRLDALIHECLPKP